jgi:hypothetical protein
MNCMKVADEAILILFLSLVSPKLKGKQFDACNVFYLFNYLNLLK